MATRKQDRPVSSGHAKSKAVSSRAKRMLPQARREQILDSAVAFIVARGLSGCTLEGVARQAGISKPLIYRYFPKLSDLLKALLEREYKFLQGRGLDELPLNADYNEVTARITQRALDYLYERGPIMQLLASDRTVTELLQGRNRDERGTMTDYFAKRCREVFGVPPDVALICTMMVVNAPILSARALKRKGVAAAYATEVWNEFTIGGWQAVQARYGKAGTTPSGE